MHIERGDRVARGGLQLIQEHLTEAEPANRILEVDLASGRRDHQPVNWNLFSMEAVSPATPSRPRLVASTRTPGHPRRTASAATALAAEAAALTPASQARALAAVKSLLAFGTAWGTCPSTWAAPSPRPRPRRRGRRR